MKPPILASLVLLASLTTFEPAHATPSTQVWIPSTDIQKHKTLHVGVDNYVRTSTETNNPNYINLGLTTGVSPLEKVGIEFGIDFLQGGQGGPALGNIADQNPFYFNAKVGTPESSLFRGAPGLAVGGYNFGTHQATKQNIVYGLASKTLPFIGRISVGGYFGDASVLGESNSGLMLSLDRQMKEISESLWIGIDHMGGDNFNASTNVGAGWAFTQRVSVILGYDIYRNRNANDSNTFTTQLDVNIF